MMEEVENKTKEQVEKEYMDLLLENSSLRKQVERLMKVIAFLTKGE